MLMLAALLPASFAGRAADPEPPRDTMTQRLAILLILISALAGLILMTATNL